MVNQVLKTERRELMDDMAWDAISNTRDEPWQGHVCDSADTDIIQAHAGPV